MTVVFMLTLCAVCVGTTSHSAKQNSEIFVTANDSVVLTAVSLYILAFCGTIKMFCYPLARYHCYAGLMLYGFIRF